MRVTPARVCAKLPRRRGQAALTAVSPTRPLTASHPNPDFWHAHGGFSSPAGMNSCWRQARAFTVAGGLEAVLDVAVLAALVLVEGAVANHRAALVVEGQVVAAVADVDVAAAGRLCCAVALGGADAGQ